MLKQPLLNTYVNNLNMEEAVQAVERLIRENQKACVIAVNVDVVIRMEKDVYLKRIVDQADLVLVDGQPLVWISKIYRKPIKAKVSGSDLVPRLCCSAAEKGFTLFILGGREGVANQARKNLERQYPRIKIVGTYAPPFGFEKDLLELEKVNRMISDAHPDLLIVCFGCPKQEKFIYENREKFDVAVSICAGATVDFLAGNVKRAPRWMSDHGLEWLYRFMKEPRRLFRRYFVDDLKILGLVWKYRSTHKEAKNENGN